MSRASEATRARQEPRTRDRVPRRDAQARLAHRTLLACTLAWFACLPAAQAPAQQPEPASKGEAAATDQSAAALEAYLDRPGLRALLAEQLAARLKGAPAEQRAVIGERLGKLYVEFIGASKTPKEREHWEARARELLKLVPDVKSYALRVDLNKAQYIKAEEIAERWRLRLATGEEKAEAEATLRQLKQQFETVGAEATRKADLLERAEDTGKSPEKVTDEVAEARRLRSIAYYYAGWSAYYLAYLSDSDQAAADAIKNFGYLLGAQPGRSATLDRLPRTLLKYDHIARATIGCGLAYGLRRDGDTEALRWLDAVDSSTDVPPESRGQLFTRRIAILAHAKRWADLEALIRLARGGDHTTPADAIRPLEAAAARLLAVVCFEADRAINGETIEALGQAAMTDLIAKGEVGQVLDIAQKYGTSPLGDSGFIVHYVRGMQALERGIKAQKDEGENPDEPTKNPATINQFRHAATLLEGSVQQTDAAKFPGERGKALVAAGRALFKAGDLPAAADRFSRAASESPDKAQAEEALWLAVISLDRATRQSGGATHQPRLDELVTLFVRQYPQTERAASLLIRRDVGAGGGIDDEQAVTILLGVPAESPVYLNARRQAARVLYQRIFRRATEAGRPSAATRFIKVAEEVMAADKRLAIESPDRKEATDATDRVVLLVRQMLDAILSLPAPDVARAEAVLDVLQAVVGHNNTDIAKLESEIKLRRIQILLAKEDTAGAERLADELRASGDRLAESADRVLYQRAVNRWKKAGGGTGQLRDETARVDPWLKAHAATVLKLGGRIIENMGTGPGALKDPAVQTVYRQVAQAGMELWEIEKIEAGRALALKLDRALLAAAKADNLPPPAESLTRVAVLAEADGDAAAALESWRTLAAGHKPGSPEWFRARFHTARLLSASDVPKAIEVLTQVAVLYPDLGPEPWRTRLTELKKRLEASQPAPAAPAGPGSPSAPGTPDPAAPGTPATSPGGSIR